MAKKIVTFGEIMLRLTPPSYGIIEDAHDFLATYGGTEANVAITLAKFKQNASFVTKLPNNQLGEAALKYLNSHLVDTSNVVVSGKNIGIYFLETGFGIRPSKVIYNRNHSAITTISIDELNLDEIFKDATWFHLSGITLALSSEVRETVKALLIECQRRGIFVSFDSNYRSKLWSIENAKKAYMEIAPFVDLFFATPFDAVNLFGIKAEENEFETLKSLLKTYQAKYVFGYRRIVHQANENSLKAYLVKADEVLETNDIRFQIYDRIGGGDAFAAGIIHSLIKDNHQNLNQVLMFGLATSVLKHTIWGDAFKLDEEDVLNFINEQTFDVKR